MPTHPVGTAGQTGGVRINSQNINPILPNFHNSFVRCQYGEVAVQKVKP